MNELPVAIHIIAKLELGGAQRIAIETARRLTGYRNILVSGPEGLLVPEALKLANVETVLLPSLKREIDPRMDFISFMEIGRLVSREVARGSKVIVHSHGSKAGVLARLAGRAARATAVVHTIHGFPFHDYQLKPVRYIYVLMERFCAKFCDALVAVSRATMHKGLKERIGEPRQYSVINPAIVDEHFTGKRIDSKSKRRDLGIGVSSLVVGTVSCFKPQKAPLDFVEVAARVHTAVPSTEFVMVGDGVLMEDVRSLASQKGLEKSFHLLGWRKDVPEVMQAFDVFLLTSLWEGLPMVHAEAMAKSIPVVATSADGSVEAIADGLNGFLAPARDVNGLAEKVVNLLQNSELRKKMGEAGKNSVSPRFTMQRLVSEIGSLYGRLLS
jgi:glycosyltransferase involved in cell wall biosynthesis